MAWRLSKIAALTVGAVGAHAAVSPVLSAAAFTNSLDRWEQKKDNAQQLRDLSEMFTKLLSVQKTLNLSVFNEHSYRLEWMVSHLNATLARQGQGRLSFSEQCRQIFDTQVDAAYLGKGQTESTLQAIDSALPKDPSRTLFHRYQAYRTFAHVPQENYEITFRSLLNEVLGALCRRVPELESVTLVQRYVHDPELPFEATCEPTGPASAEIVVNLAKPITLDKAQQLAAHELIHHLQFMLMERHLFPQFPEMRRLAVDNGPLSLLLEGGAEFMVDHLFPQHDRVESLLRLLPALSRAQAEQLLELEELTWAQLWPACIRIAQQFVDGQIDEDQAVRLMQSEALKAANSWPNVDFYREHGAYVIGYGWGKELIRRYLRARARGHETDLWQAYVDFVKRPVTPAAMMREITAQEAVQAAKSSSAAGGLGEM